MSWFKTKPYACYFGSLCNNERTSLLWSFRFFERLNFKLWRRTLTVNYKWSTRSQIFMSNKFKDPFLMSTNCYVEMSVNVVSLTKWLNGVRLLFIMQIFFFQTWVCYWHLKQSSLSSKCIIIDHWLQRNARDIRALVYSISLVKTVKEIVKSA